MKINGMSHFQSVCKNKLVNWCLANNGKFDAMEDDVFIVWSCKALQNYKCLASTTSNDGIYAEYTFNGLTGELYEDVYSKSTNRCYTTE